MQKGIYPKRTWILGQPQAESFEKLKAEIATPIIFLTMMCQWMLKSGRCLSLCTRGCATTKAQW